MGLRNWWYWLRWRGKKPLGEEEFKESKKAMVQKAALRMREEEREAAVKARRAERTTRIALRNLDRNQNRAADILGKMWQAVARGSREEFKRRLKYWNGQVYQLEHYKVKMGGYAGIIAKILMEMVGLVKGKKEQKKKLLAFGKLILKDLKELETNIAEISDNVRKISDSTPPDDNLWTAINAAVESASKLVTNIRTHAEGALALEIQIREKIGRA